MRKQIWLSLALDCFVLLSVWLFVVHGTAPSTSWASTNFLGFGGIEKGIANALQPFGGNLYVGTAHDAGAQLWRLRAGEWTGVMSDGFGDASNYGINHLIEYAGQLYAAMWNEQKGAEIWCSTDGTSWNWVVNGGFGDPAQAEVLRLAVFKNALYAGTISYDEAKGAQLWRSTSGNRGSWVRVVNNGFGDARNAAIVCIQEFNGYLYAGTGNFATGGEIWRSSDGARWSQVNTDGFGSSCAYFVSALAAFNGYLYASTTHTAGCGGAEVWRCQVCNNSDWQRVVSNGFGDADARGISALEVFDGQLYFFVGNAATGMQVWHTQNGTQWTQVGFAGFGNKNNRSPYYDNSVAVYNGNLYVGAVNWGGSDVWVYLHRHLCLPLLLRRH